MLIKENFFFSKEECEEIIILCEKVGIKSLHKINVYNKWDILRIHDDSLKGHILKKYKEVFLNDTEFPYDLSKITIDEIYVSLTRYYDDRFLEMHRDTSSDLTSVIVLTDNFADGRFVLSDEKISIESNTFNNSNLYSINQGNGLTFNGHTIWHGVLPVSIGIRKSLNIWLNPTSFKMQIGEKNISAKIKKTLI
jgi:hypothetical protein